jgi:hypothetical protein
MDEFQTLPYLYKTLSEHMRKTLFYALFLKIRMQVVPDNNIMR